MTGADILAALLKAKRMYQHQRGAPFALLGRLEFAKLLGVMRQEGEVDSDQLPARTRYHNGRWWSLRGVIEGVEIYTKPREQDDR